MARCILIAGMPASGKTTFARHLSAQLLLPMISKDCLKELMYDTIGFKSKAEKVTLSITASEILYYFADSLMAAGVSFILENNFENVQKPRLSKLLQQYSYEPLTVRFVGDVQVIYKRYLNRNTSAERHGGHKTSYAWPHQDSKILNAPPSFEEFISGVQTRGIGDFSIGGEEIQVDVTDFSQLSYETLVGQIRNMLAYGSDI
ncbi:MAG: ATP-binding protein [Ruminococcaceae bacterium]|nr:ATP-binding protein [Oscillospiraceae bacterium]